MKKSEPVHLRAGTSGYSYKEWKPHFYPQDLPAKAMLGFYAERLDTVEINNTFYRMPAKKVLQGWAAEVPGPFCFSIKATRRVTHFKRLRDVGSELDFLFGNLSALGEKLGPVLFQLPPRFPADLPLLQDFLAQLPPGKRYVLEFRDPSWFDESVYAALQESGVAMCAMEEEDEEARVVPTAAFGYLRLRRDTYPKKALRAWRERIAKQPWQEAFVYFKHESKAPQQALDLMQLE
jgi:uncharacterized protein YecE (DUF72 family)